MADGNILDKELAEIKKKIGIGKSDDTKIFLIWMINCQMILL